MRVSVAEVGDPGHCQIFTERSEEKRRFYYERRRLKQDTLPETFWTSVSIGFANPNYGFWREDKPEEETCD